MSSLPFELAAATVLGREHARAGRNNQDALWARASEQGLAAVVADGCGSGAQSELGAQLGARRVVEGALSLLGQVPVDSPEFLQRLGADVLCLLQAVSGQLGERAIGEALLFTIVGAVVTPEHTLVFSAGDGLWALNGEVHRLGPFPGNAPPYLAYGLLKPGVVALKANSLRPTAEVDSLLLGTDGVSDLAGLAEAQVPEREEPVGPLSQFWSEDRYFSNPDALRRRLALLNRESVRADFPARRLVRVPGLLTDDTTLVVLRRRQGRA
ncbi:protein phosphatase 2C domain-containing protein [Archangium violaceum]|uniref:protein phosphatase 2C domain-containing protein n=1 Tax=Archangium violaceum TaxID=83451 RepID=UPI00194E267A|nr:protein phosphatase 2C domain-containing protein [Archangium violaceum]QRN98111.1 protein phosphatase 2C domain-containing protein [Archangium violaceum]